MICQFCGQKNPPDAQYCEHCGTKLQRLTAGVKSTQFGRYRPGAQAQPSKPAVESVVDKSSKAAPSAGSRAQSAARRRVDILPKSVEDIDEPTLKIPAVRPQAKKAVAAQLGAAISADEPTLIRPKYSERKEPITLSGQVDLEDNAESQAEDAPVTKEGAAAAAIQGAKTFASAFAAKFARQNPQETEYVDEDDDDEDDEDDEEEEVERKMPSYLRRPANAFARRDLGDDDNDDDDDDAGAVPAKPSSEEKSHKLHKKSSKNSNIYVIALCAVGAIAIILFGWLFFTGSGQDVRDAITGTVRPEKLWVAGDAAYEAGDYATAVTQYEAALREQTDNYAGCLKLGMALVKQGNTQRAELAFRRCMAIQPKAIEPYIQLAEILKNQRREAELFEILDQGRAATGDTRLLEMYNTLDLPAPGVSITGGTHVAPLTIELSSDSSAQIYYTLNNTKPTTRSFLYAAPILLNEGTYTLRAVSVLNGVSSPELMDTYTVSNASGEIPEGAVSSLTFSANPGRYASDEGQKTKTIQIYIPEGSTAYYTTNGSDPTTKSAKYSGAIRLPIGTTMLKAMAINADKVPSSIISSEYTILDASVKMFDATDKFNSFELMNTTKAASMKQFASLKDDTDYGNGRLKQTASWGWVEYLNVDGTEVVTDVYVDTSNLTAVRGTKVGMSYNDILGKFYSEPADPQGDKLMLYSKADTGSYGWVVLLDGQPTEVHYQVNVSGTQFNELTYTIVDGRCVSIQLAVRNM